MNRITLIVLAIVIIAGAAWFGYSRSYAPQQSETPAAQNTQGTATEPGISNTGTGSAAIDPAAITMTDVAKHASASDCWVAISGKAYDMTSYIPQHPGGARAITKTCGTDGTAVFDGERAHQRTGTAEELARYYVGDVR